MIASEIEKYALFLGAAPSAPRELQPEALQALGVDSQGDLLAMVNLALDGRTSELSNALQSLAGSDVIAILRTFQRRLLQLAPMRARIEGGERVDAVMASAGKALFYKEKPVVQTLLSRWSAARLAQLVERIAALERTAMLTSVSTAALLGEELLTIARNARR